ncbi:MAG: DUF927 domain-containing protein [Oscillospiraceae bacterium]|nr:DUF927 domain-containing protein [Oscillospiraceae bacterium]
MPIQLNREAVLQRDLRDIRWFAETLGDLLYAPGMTQTALEENLTTLRECFREKNIDGVFVEYFTRMAETLQSSESYAETGLILRLPYTKDDFLYTDAPYKEIAGQKTAFARGQVTQQLAEIAKKLGVTGFKQLCAQYDRGMETQVAEGRHLAFPLANTDEKVILDPGEWHIDSTGIYKIIGLREEYACTHPIAPVKRLTNIDTGMEKLMIAYERGGRIRYLIRDKQALFDSKKIIELSAVGIAVTSKTAGNLAQFLCEVEDMNYEAIPEQDSVGRLGWLQDGRFSPYVQDLAFDGDAAYGTIFRAIREQGDFEQWRECAIKCRSESITAQIMLAASFASVLIKKLGCLPFFVHLWGVDSGTGKTVGLMLAASVWGDPELGQYPQTFNATTVGHEKTAAFLGNIPMCIDELQLSKDSHGHSRFDVYQLAQGVGRTRGNKAGGIDSTPTWSLCILTTGESPIVQANAGAGAVNRVIDIECKADEAVIRDGAAVCKIIKSNFGGAGRRFIEGLTDDRLALAQKMYDLYFQQLSDGETTEKQAMAAALILTADALADEIIFRTGRHLTADVIAEFLKTKTAVSAGQRGYDYLCDWVAINSAKFSGEGSGDSYGLIEGDIAYINRTMFRNACKEGGFDESALLSWLRKKGLIQTRGRAYTRPKRIAGVPVECVVMKLSQLVQDEPGEDELL